ncbi:hypothetical protein HPB50_022210 [Hyalomma asiaticum]|uniref:Uncharacterized protein n=1 Tax=Hyalomma asiaticum TaxID=266040 RepID=A0ACB7S989_HYAAI|nr:hypothetical protein HPB50_022210 [Hyalomma asiaticum]
MKRGSAALVVRERDGRGVGEGVSQWSDTQTHTTMRAENYGASGGGGSLSVGEEPRNRLDATAGTPMPALPRLPMANRSPSALTHRAAAHARAFLMPPCRP